jgi:hypothetical protein
MITAKTPSVVKANTAASDLDDTFIAEQNGTHDNAIDDSERENTYDLVKLLNLSEKDKADGLIFSKEQLFSELF